MASATAFFSGTPDGDVADAAVEDVFLLPAELSLFAESAAEGGEDPAPLSLDGLPAFGEDEAAGLGMFLFVSLCLDFSSSRRSKLAT